MLALLQGLGGGLISPLLMQVDGSRQAGEAGQQGQVGFARAAQGWGLGRLQGPAGQLKTFEGLTRLQQQQQTAHLFATRHIQGGHQRRLAAGKGGQVGFVGLTPAAVAEQVGAGAQQFFASQQGFLGKPLVWCPVDALLQGAQQGLQVRCRVDSEQPEMIDRQFQSRLFTEG